MKKVIRNGFGLAAALGLLMGAMTPSVATADVSIPSSVYGCPQPSVGAIWHHYLFMWTTWPASSSTSTCKEQCKVLLDGCIKVVTSAQKCASDEINAASKIGSMACKTNQPGNSGCPAGFKAQLSDGLAWLKEDVAEANTICKWGYDSCLDSCDNAPL